MNTNGIIRSLKVTSAAVAGSIALLAALPAAAQPQPSYATHGGDETIHGTIASVNGQYNISVRDARGFVDNVTLHQGTIINPTGLTLAAGQSVTILGTNEGSTFAANEIDTPYLAYDPALYPAYGYGYGWGYGWPGYDVGLRFGRGFGFGFRGR